MTKHVNDDSLSGIAGGTGVDNVVPKPYVPTPNPGLGAALGGSVGGPGPSAPAAEGTSGGGLDDMIKK